MARYRCEHCEFLVGSLERLGEIDFLDTPFATVPPDAVFDSIIAHELTHALLYHARPNMTRIGQDDLAHGVQVSMMPNELRGAFLTSTELEGPAAEIISLTVLHFVPAHFASASWEYFEEAGGYCAAIEEVLRGETPF